MSHTLPTTTTATVVTEEESPAARTPIRAGVLLPHRKARNMDAGFSFSYISDSEDDADIDTDDDDGYILDPPVKRIRKGERMIRVVTRKKRSVLPLHRKKRPPPLSVLPCVSMRNFDPNPIINEPKAPKEIRVDYEMLQLETKIEQNFGRHFFGNRVKVQVRDDHQSRYPHEFQAENGRLYQLLSRKLSGSRDSGVRNAGNKVNLMYVEAESADVLQAELDRIADFSSLPLRKQACRLELFQSPCVKFAGGESVIHSFDTSEFEFIQELGHEGCGFIPRTHLRTILGDRKKYENTFALQVRIMSPGLGIFKGSKLQWSCQLNVMCSRY